MEFYLLVSSYDSFTLHCYGLCHILSAKTNYEEFSNLKRIEKKIEKSSVKPMIGFDRKDMK